MAQKQACMYKCTKEQFIRTFMATCSDQHIEKRKSYKMVTLFSSTLTFSQCDFGQIHLLWFLLFWMYIY